MWYSEKINFHFYLLSISSLIAQIAAAAAKKVID
jgi:hypothetical protein